MRDKSRPLDEVEKKGEKRGKNGVNRWLTASKIEVRSRRSRNWGKKGGVNIKKLR